MKTNYFRLFHVYFILWLSLETISLDGLRFGRSHCFGNRCPSRTSYAIFGTLQNRLSENMPLSSTMPQEEWNVLSFNELKSHMFAHPTDIQITKVLSRIPFVESAARKMYRSIEQAMVVENLGSGVLVGPQQMPELYKSLVSASKILDINVPDLYVRQNPTPNAYTLAFIGKKPFIVVHTGLLDILDEQEIMAVVGHELGHLKCEHGVWITLLTALSETVGSFLGPFKPLRSLLLRWQRSAEFTGDRAALLVTQDHRVVVSVLMKLCGGSAKNAYSKNMNVDAFLEQAKLLEKEKRSLSGSMFLWANSQVATHPVPLIRAVELLDWSNSAQFSGLVRRARRATLRF